VSGFAVPARILQQFTQPGKGSGKYDALLKIRGAHRKKEQNLVYDNKQGLNIIDIIG
jgi:hypothetical protein